MKTANATSKSKIQVEIYSEPNSPCKELHTITSMLNMAERLRANLFEFDSTTSLCDVRMVGDENIGSDRDTKAGELSEDCGPNDDAADLVIIPDLPISLDAPLGREYQRTIEWLWDLYQNKHTSIAAIGSGTILLAAAGLLNKSDAAAPWIMLEYLQRNFPPIRLHPSRIICASGEYSRLVTSGGDSSGNLIMYYLITRYFGAGYVAHVAQNFPRPNQSLGGSGALKLFATLMAEDPDLLNCQRWLHQNLSNHDVIEDMAARSDLPSDKFHRRFKAETGFAAQSYVDLARTEEAKYLLRTTETTIEEIAEQIGFLDEHQFKSVFHREAGISASQYRAPPCLVPLDQAEQRRTSMMIWKRIEKMRREVHSHAAV